MSRSPRLYCSCFQSTKLQTPHPRIVWDPPRSQSAGSTRTSFLVGCDKTLSGCNNKRASTKKGVVKIFIVSIAGEERSHCKEWHWRALQSIRTPIERQHANTVTTRHVNKGPFDHELLASWEPEKAPDQPHAADRRPNGGRAYTLHSMLHSQNPRDPDDTYIKSICPSGGHGRGHRLAPQNRAAARNVTV